MRARAVLTALLFVLLLPGFAVGENETPNAKTGLQIEPYAFDLGLMGNAVSTKLPDQGYAVTTALQTSRGTSPSITLTTYTDYLDDGFGYWFVGSHGNTNGHTVEAYEYSPAGLAARDTSFVHYKRAGWTESQIYKSYLQDHGYGIGIFAATIGSHFSSAKTIVHNGCCEGQTYQATAWPSARVKLGYSACPLNSTVASNATALLQKMNGESGKANRDIANARSGLAIECSGSENTVLAPVIIEIYPADGAPIMGNVSGWVTFDTKMDTGSDPECVVRCDGWTQGGVVPDDVHWAGNTMVYYTLHPFKIGPAPFAVSNTCAMSDGGGMIIDGNTNPSGSDGRGPNRDLFRVVYDSRVFDPTLEARFEGTWAWQETDGTHVGWITDGERGSTLLDLYADNTVAMTVPAAGSPDHQHYYECTVPDGTVFAIRERDNDPTTPDDYSRPFTISAPPESLQAMRSLNDVVRSLPPVPLTDFGSYEQRGGEPPTAYYTDVVFYSSRQDFLDLTQPIRTALQSKGVTSQTILGSSNPLEAKARYAEVWQRAVAEHRPNPPFLVIVGEAHSDTDHPDWNIVGTIILGDPGGDCYFGSNCATDQLIVDADGDSLADGFVSRINVKTTAELQNANATTLDLYNNQHVSSPRALFMVGDLNMCNIVNEPAATCNTIRGWYTAKGIPTIRLLDSSYSDCYDFTSRYNDAKNAVNTSPGITEIAGMGYTTNRSVWPGYFFQKTSNPVFNPADLTRVQRIIVELIGCGTNDGDRANPSYYPSISKATEVANPATGTTVVAALGNTRAGFEITHTMLAEAYFHERLYGFNWCIQQAFYKAIRQIGEGQNGLRHYLLLCESYGYPAWAPGMPPPSGVAEELPRATTMTLASSPNPTHSSSVIHFTLPHLTHIAVAVYDVAGRHVVRVADSKVWPAGDHSLAWDGNDSNGRPVAAGAYFIRLDADDASFTAKTIVLR